MAFAVGDKVLLAEHHGYLGLGPEGIVLAVSETYPNDYPYRVVVAQPDGTVDALIFAESELEAI